MIFLQRCIIFAGGKSEQRIPYELDTNGAFIIAADKGYKTCKRFGITPALTVGDLDSLKFIPDDCETLQFPTEKDDTDLMIAVKEALKRGCKDITILCALGGRFDHLYGNLQTLCYIVKNGGWGRLLSCYEQITIVPPGSYKIKNKERFSLSLLSYSSQVKGLSVSGVKYPLENGVINNGFPIGVSNVITAEYAQISFTDGLLLIVQSRL